MTNNKYRTIIIGFGACGDKLAYQAAKEAGFTSLAVNSTPMDLKEIEEDQDSTCSSLVLSDEGCGKERSLSKELIKKHYEKIISYVQNQDNLLKEKDAIVKNIITVGSYSNGTGSGALPIVSDILAKTFKKKNVIMFPVLPYDTSVRSMINSAEAINETISIGLPYVMIDNSKCEISAVSELHAEVNKDIIENFKIIRGDYFNYSDISNVDEKDRSKVYATPGLLKIGKTFTVKGNVKDINKEISECIDNGYGVDHESDMIVRRVIVILNLSEGLLEKVDKDYKVLKNRVGNPIEIFDHINVVPEGQENSIQIILSGLSSPDTKIKDYLEIVQKAKEDAEAIAAKKAKKAEIDIAGSLSSWLDEVDDKVDDAEESIEDLFSKY